MIEFLNLRRLNEPYQKVFQEKFASFLEKGWFVLGDEVTSFEEEYAAYCGTKHCVGTANGLDALRMILEGYKILGKLEEGDEVLVCGHTYIATIIGVMQAGLKPVLVDADIETFNFDFSDLEQKISSKTKVVMPTHLYGRLVDVEKINAFAKAKKLLIVTDAAQSHGAIALDGKRSGALGDASGHSFYPTKNLGALGDAGAVTTNDTALANVLKSYRNYGFEQRYVARFVGINSRLDEIQAAFLRIKLKDLDTQNNRRREIANLYLKGIIHPDIVLPQWAGSNSNVFHLFVVRCKQREQLRAHLENRGVKTIIHYPVPPHKQKALEQLKNLSLPITERLHDEVLSLPIDPMMNNQDVELVITAVNDFSCH